MSTIAWIGAGDVFFRNSSADAIAPISAYAKAMPILLGRCEGARWADERAWPPPGEKRPDGRMGLAVDPDVHRRMVCTPHPGGAASRSASSGWPGRPSRIDQSMDRSASRRQPQRPGPAHPARAADCRGSRQEEPMGLFSSMTLNSLDDLFTLQLQDLYDAEQRLTKALPKMADAASNGELKSAFQKHLRETEQHVQRLEKVFGILGSSARRETCEAMKGLISEGDEAVNASGASEVRRRGTHRRGPARRALRDRRLRHRAHPGRPARPQGDRPHPPGDPGRGGRRRQEVDPDRRVAGQRPSREDLIWEPPDRFRCSGRRTSGRA